MYPTPLPQHPTPQDTFQHIRRLADGEKRQNRQVRKPAQAKGQGDGAHPHEAAVEEKGDEGFTAGAEGEVSGIGKGLEGHNQGADKDQVLGQGPDGVGGVVHVGEEAGAQGHKAAEEDTHGDGEGDELPVKSGP